MINQAKDYKVKNEKGEFLSFDFDSRTGQMNPIWGPISMSYPFTQDEAYRLSDVHYAEPVHISEIPGYQK